MFNANKFLTAALLGLLIAAAPLAGQIRMRFGQLSPGTPVITIGSPTLDATYATSSSALVLSGSHENVTTVTWTCDVCGSGTGTITGATWTSSTITLLSGANVVTVSGNAGATTAVLTVTYTPSDVTAPTITIANPSTATTYSTAESRLSFSGTASDAVGVTSVTWTCSGCPVTAGTASGTASWSATIDLTEGSNVLTFTAHDQAANTGTDAITVTYTAAAPVPLEVLTSNLGTCTVGSSFSRTLQASGGTEPYTWNRQSGDTFPDGLTLTGAVLSGTPTTAQSKTFVVRVTDAVAATDDSVSLTLNCVASGAETSTAFFTEQIARPEIAGGENVGYWSLRDATSVASARDSACTADNHWAYVFGTDTYGNPQDAMKFIGTHSLSSSHQMQFSLPAGITSGKVMMVWDFWYGPEYSGLATETALKANFQQKVFNIRDYGTSPAIWLELNHNLRTTAAASLVSPNTHRMYGIGTTRWPQLALTDDDPYAPTGLSAQASNAYSTNTGTWTRYWAEVILDQPSSAFTDWSTTHNGGVPISTWDIVDSTAGATTTVNITGNLALTVSATFTVTITGNVTLNGTYTATAVDADTFTIPLTTGSGSSGGSASRHWHMVSYWMADENRDPVRLLYKVPHVIRNAGRVARFDFEFNTSASGKNVMKGWSMSAAPTVAAQSLITTATAHNLAVNDYVFFAATTTIGGNVPFRVASVPTSTTFTVDETVSSLAAANGDGTFGYVARTFVGYARNLIILRNLDASDADSTLFRKPVR